MVKKPTSGDSEQRDRDSERSRKASQLSAGGADFQKQNARVPRRDRDTPSNGGPEEESAHGALMREGIDSD
jgi:hypothetical protein